MRKYRGKKQKRCYNIVMDYNRWMKYSCEDQQKILSKYNVLLKNHKTRKGKLRALFKTSKKEKNVFKKFNKYISMISKGIDQFSKTMNDFKLESTAGDKQLNRITKGLEKASGVRSKNRYAALVGNSNMNYDTLIGNSSRKIGSSL